MRSGGILLAVRDRDTSIDFYREVLGLEVKNDFGANVELTGGVFLQTLDSWVEFLGAPEIRFGGNDAELYFETEDYDAFLMTLQDHGEIELIHPSQEHNWGQRAVRLYDPDHHIIEVGEAMSAVCRRFRDSGLTEEGIALRMDVTVGYVREQLK